MYLQWYLELLSKGSEVQILLATGFNQTVLVEIEFLLGDVLQRAQLWTAIKTQRMAESAAHGCVLIDALRYGLVTHNNLKCTCIILCN